MIQISKYLEFLSKLGIEGAHPGGINLTKKILNKENINSTAHILDVGCGTGQTAAYIADKYGATVTGIDFNPAMVEMAKRRMKENHLSVKVIQGTVEKMPFPNNYFDLIISESVLSFVNKPIALKEIRRVLKNNGRFIAIEQTISHQLEKKEENEIKQFYGFPSLSREEDWMALIKEAGFGEIQIEKNTSIRSVQNFYYSGEIEPELYEILEKHYDITIKYQGILGYRIYSCTK